MNPGGVVSEEHYEGGLAVVNGHSYEDRALRTGNTNFAMLVSTSFTEPFRQPIEYGQYVARLANMLTGSAWATCSGATARRATALRNPRRYRPWRRPFRATSASCCPRATSRASWRR